MLSVAFCIDNMNVGGTELNAVRTAERLVTSGVQLRVFSLADEGPLLDRYHDLSIPVLTFPLGKLYGRRAFRAGRELSRVIRRDNIQILHAHDFYSNVFAAPWARLGGAAFIASRRWWEGPPRRARRLANRASYSLAHRVLANSESVARLLIEDENVRPDRVVVVPNFLDDTAFDDPPRAWLDRQRHELSLPAGALVVGSVGSLSPIKHNALLVRAAAELRTEFPDLHVVLIGRDAGSRTHLEILAEDLGLRDVIKFTGQMPQHPSAHYLLDVSVLTSFSEGLPNSVLEAMAAARPVIATRVGAVPDAVVDGVTGFIVPPDDQGALTGTLRRLLRDTELRRRFGSAGRKRAREQYSAEPAIAALLHLYRSVIRGGASSAR